MDRTKTRSRRPEDLPSRVVYQLQWRPFQKTILAFRDFFLDAWLDVTEGVDSGERIEFHHFGNDRFLVRKSSLGSEWNSTEISG